MSAYTLNGRPVEIEIAGSLGDYTVQVGNYFDGAMEVLTDAECDDALAENDGKIHENLLGTAIDRAHDFGRDR